MDEFSLADSQTVGTGYVINPVGGSISMITDDLDYDSKGTISEKGSVAGSGWNVFSSMFNRVSHSECLAIILLRYTYLCCMICHHVYHRKSSSWYKLISHIDTEYDVGCRYFYNMIWYTKEFPCIISNWNKLCYLPISIILTSHFTLLFLTFTSNYTQ